jgi:hypothetical protein
MGASRLKAFAFLPSAVAFARREWWKASHVGGDAGAGEKMLDRMLERLLWIICRNEGLR